MNSPYEITALLESVLGVFLSGVRHRERAAFILCDELVEMTCRRKAAEHDHSVRIGGFHDAWNAPGVELEPEGLGQRVQNAREHRNVMQHVSGAATVDEEHCANAILDATMVIEHCWPGAAERDFKSWVTCALRIIALYSRHGDAPIRTEFEDLMRDEHWDEEGENRELRANEVAVRLGHRGYWLQAVTVSQSSVDALLDRFEL